MRQITQLVIAIVMMSFGLRVSAQDSQPLGDAARQAKLQKQEKDAKSKATPDAKTPRVITEEQMPERPELAAQSAGHDHESSPEPNDSKISAEEWKSKIQEQENLVHTHEAELSKLNGSIHYAPPNCVTGCMQWNERQKQKQDQAERLQTQLDEEKKSLEDMQEGARQQGYGSSVYEP